ncbi:glycoside hydrolase family 19 protein [Dongshaea marina]|uniref:glycoside hydrolase family 19 protein n=1 Tax=Dongshaea marina TaxID=2047966 RepID=UPI001F48996A|nr:glycoside hydrolase family 19 protein [Dongshaea marina]
MTHLKKLLLSTSLALMTCEVAAAQLYDPSKNYPSGSQVSFNGAIYQAKWWANPSQSPGDQVSAPWETPWKLIGQTDDTPPPAEPDEPADTPDSPSVPSDGQYSNYQEGGSYQGGDIVLNNGQLYRCKPGVTVPWCSGAGWAYAPGTGTAWDSAWELVSEDEIAEPDPETPEVPDQPVEPEVPSDPGDGYQVTQAQLDAREAELTSDPLLSQVKESIRTRDNQTVEAVTALSGQNPENVKRVEAIVSEADWDYLFAKRSPEYSYRHFLQAVAKFPAFCASYEDGRDSEAICRRSLATMFAHFTQETGGHTEHWDVPEWRQGLVHAREMGWTEQMRGGYNGECNPATWQGQTWPCGTFDNGEYKSYFGRGAKQLSYNYNYGPFSEAMFGTVRTLLDHPEMVADTWLNLASAVFFFTYPQPPKPSMLHVIDGTWQPNSRDEQNGLYPGFGVTTQIINGGVECGGTTEVAQSVNRISYFRSFASYLGVTIAEDEILGCRGMKQFDAEGAGATNIYWEKDWGWSADTPSGGSYACQLVGYQTPYSALKQGDYTACVKAHFPDIQVIE